MKMFRDYFLKTDRLGFGYWSEDDRDLAMLLWHDPKVTALIGGPFSEEAVVARLDREIETMRLHNIQYWPLFSLVDGEFVGCAGLRPQEGRDGIVELGFHLRPDYWGRGLAYEAGRAVIEYGFGQSGIKGIFTGHHPKNAASKNTIEKLGFHYTHEAVYPPTGIAHSYYLLMKPVVEIER